MTSPALGNHNRSENAGLYVHVPFCRSKCAYCDFYSITDHAPVGEYFEALSREMAFYRNFAPVFDTVYIGGGTPSCLSAARLSAMLQCLRSAFPVSQEAEITVEVNPGDVDFAYLERLRQAGFNRLSIGVQSFDNGILNSLGRRHSGHESREAVRAARSAGYDNLSVDLIYAVPGQSRELWQQTMETALGFDPEHLSCYELTIEEGTPFHCRVKEGRAAIPGEEEQYWFFSATSEVLEEHGYIHYEVSNFARGEAFVSRHNQKYWDHTPYLGLGPAAHSFRGHRRCWNHGDLGRYIRDLRSGRMPTGAEEDLTAEELRTEALHFGFRTKRGIHGHAFRERYGMDLFREKGIALRSMQEEGLIRIDGEALSPTRRGLALADRLCLL